MKVALACPGRFHGFNLACQLQERGALSRLITTYPKRKVMSYGVDGRRVASYPSIEVFKRLTNRARDKFPRLWNPQLAISAWFDKTAAQAIPHDSDIVVSFSGSALHTLERAKSLGAVAICERGSSHMLYQTRIMEEEYDRFGLRFDATHPGIIDQEIAEYSQADYIAIPSLFAERTFVSEGVPQDKILRIPYGVSLEHFKPSPRKDDVFRVIHCGTVSLRKGVQYLVRAFTELNLTNAELLLVGPVEPVAMDVIRPYLTNQVKLIGHKPEPELHQYYTQSDVFCLASIEDGFGMVLGQAMACSLPIIATTNTGAEDIYSEGEHGWIISIRDVGALKDRISWCHSHRPQCREMGRAAREHVVSEFTWEHYGKRIMTAYTRALGRGVMHERQLPFTRVEGAVA